LGRTEKKALKRDNYKCKNCGIGQEEHKKKYKTELHVDHIIPRKKFVNEKDYFFYKKANRLTNLQTLCVKCHREIEVKKKSYIL
jgi:5-methylcytosine-specific restriction endonuclease McrA